MRDNSRTSIFTINASVATICQIIQIVIAFLSRKIFVILLGAEYLGVNSVFASVLGLLSFAELGIGNVFAYRLYKPLSTDSCDDVAKLMHFYRVAYSIIGTFILILGLGIGPFITQIVVNTPDIKENLTVLYYIFLSNTVLSYFFGAYRKGLLIADQKNYMLEIFEKVLLIVCTLFPGL